jgi:hypothetical protein
MDRVSSLVARHNSRRLTMCNKKSLDDRIFGSTNQESSFDIDYSNNDSNPEECGTNDCEMVDDGCIEFGQW